MTDEIKAQLERLGAVEVSHQYGVRTYDVSGWSGNLESASYGWSCGQYRASTPVEAVTAAVKFYSRSALERATRLRKDADDLERHAADALAYLETIRGMK